MTMISKSVKDTLGIGRAIAKNLQKGDVICLFGQLGSGKTVLAKGIAGGLGIEKNKVISPSFVLIREHNSGKLPVYHFDLYRLKDPKDIAAIGYEEYLYGDGVSIIEWADRLGYLLPRGFLKIELSFKDSSRRSLKFSASGRRYKELLERIHEDIRH
ncbi:MAG: tRNA (adenosine(37)-N6)-threonylcarbamoyltransferase complex ATPase subunit type 1 TsaE [Candidatus Omnitrophota bacterium]